MEVLPSRSLHLFNRSLNLPRVLFYSCIPWRRFKQHPIFITYLELNPLLRLNIIGGNGRQNVKITATVTPFLAGVILIGVRGKAFKASCGTRAKCYYPYHWALTPYS